MDRVVVQLDIFPARAQLPISTTYEQVRAVIADGILRLYRLTGSGIDVVYERASLGVEGAASSGIGVTTEDGVVWLELSEGCGCGSQLKTTDLFPGHQTVMIPLHS